MFTVALTGGIASGKSTVAELFSQHHITIIDTDIIARNCVMLNTAAYQNIIKHFGKTILQADGNINRILLKKIIFNDKSERLWLESLLHPLIREIVKKQIQEAASIYCIVVIPLLAETDSANDYDRVCVVDVEETIQKQRLLQRENIDNQLAQSILHNQATRQQRLAIADDIIINNSTLEELKKQVDKLHQKYNTISCLSPH